MRTFDIVAHPTAPELDRAWFADRRRHFRFRPPFPGEPGGAVLVRRDGARIVFDGEPTPARFEMGAHENLCAVVWRSLEAVGFPIEPPNKKATAEAAAEITDRRASADFTKDATMPRATTDRTNAE
ncbi:MAG: hypothetical protein E7773_00780 [Sphingomonas sp.]|uniref:hypothetical protein n=1 Tax=Sphingomonas sp. TaxID=28214 RepID=UPI00120AE289|nr:hypothetical protein [Sphingomonas sp.]THD38321.1 MAG: hypothetical protein E7773_00780 [Sphingomonas sp.]